MSQPTTSGIVSPPQKIMPPRSRTQSISSDRPSTVAFSFMSPPLTVSPEAAFIAASAASQIVTNDHDSHADAWYDQHGVEPSGETAVVSTAALQLVNNFLDQLLFNFLSTARSTSLSALRPAVSEVLKPKLAKDAINQADEELREYLGGDDEDVGQAQSASPVSPRDWDLELAWKRTRLRCMVYSSLGDMEEEDEDFYTEQDHLDPAAGDGLSEVVSPAVAIFLTSILEFMGEQALIVAGQASFHRMRTKYEKEIKDGARSPSDPADRVLVEELDMERVALDRTLGRLWRAWKKKIRSPGITTMDQRLSRSYSRDSMHGVSGHLRSPSSITAEPTVPETVPEPVAVSEIVDDIQEEPIVEELLEEYLVAAGIPLPIGARDVDEIEVPGLAYYSDDETETDELDEELLPIRPKSWMVFSAADKAILPASAISEPISPVFIRKRSNSLPTPVTVPFNWPRSEETEELEAADEPLQAGDEILSDGVINSELQSPSSVAEIQIRKSGWSESEDEPTPAASTTVQSPIPQIGQAVSDDVEIHEEPEEYEDELAEEPQILISSRVSISGRSISPAASERGKPTAINTNLPIRTPSIHSARLVDVTAPRSPAVPSRRSSADVGENARLANPSRLSGGRTPPVIEERMRRSPDSMSAFRSPALKSGLSGTHSISEAEEIAGIPHGETTSPTSPTSESSGAGASLAVIPEPAVVERREEPVAPRAQAPPSPVKPVTKVTIISSTASSGTFFMDDKPEPQPQLKPEPSRKQSRPQPTTPTNQTFPVSQPPEVPERSAVRQPKNASPARASPPRTQQASTIGQVSVERSRNRSPSEPFPPRVRDSPNASRQQHTSGSTSSASTTRLKPVRTSEETTRSRIDVARNFEELINSDQTIQYTLTPESMRDVDAQSNRSNVTGSPVIPVKRRSEDARQNGDRSRSSSFAQSSEVKRSMSITRSTAQIPAAERKNSLNTVQSNVSNVSVPRSAPSVPAKPTANVPQPRDARLPRESLSEFADFIRSTGPNGSSVVRNSVVPGPVPKASIDSGRVSTTSSVTRARLQARDAAVDHRDDNSDLIDFIRRGPPSAPGNPRIPRTVAPFRTTMDSDQLAAAVGGRAVDAQLRDVEVRSSQASTNATEASSSVNSQSALLGRNKPLPGGSNRYGGARDDDMPMPKRKTRRVRDPYAIDLSDEEDDIDDDPRQRRRQEPKEESLLDFLKSVPPPPPEPVAQPVQAPVKPKKKSSAPSLMARFTRRTDSGRNSQSSSGNSSPRSPVPPQVTTTTNELRPVNSRASSGKGYIPIQVNIPPGADPYNPANYSKASTMVGGGSSQPAPTRRVPMKKFEPREAVAVSSRGTSELAEFFKNSAPPGGMAPPSQASAADDSGRYARRKKTSVA